MRIARRLPLVCGMVASLGSPGHALAQSHQPVLPKSHRHPFVERPWTVEDSIPEFSIADTSLAAATAKENLVTDRARRYQAFTVSDMQRFQLFVVERRTGKTREIQGLPFAWRPFSNLV